MHHTVARIILAATIACGVVHMAITVMPVIYHNGPYHSPISALCWYIPRKLVELLLSVAHCIVRVLQKQASPNWADPFSKLATRISERKKDVKASIATAREHAALHQDWKIDAQALSWTLDKSDEEGQLEHVVAGIPKFLLSRAVEDPTKVLEEAAKGNEFRPSLYREVTTSGKCFN